MSWRAGCVLWTGLLLPSLLLPNSDSRSHSLSLSLSRLLWFDAGVFANANCVAYFLGPVKVRQLRASQFGLANLRMRADPKSWQQTNKRGKAKRRERKRVGEEERVRETRLSSFLQLSCSFSPLLSLCIHFATCQIDVSIDSKLPYIRYDLAWNFL